MENSHDSRFDQYARNNARHWLFQANPSRYRIHRSLARETDEWWNLNQHATEVQAGDFVAVWISGDEAGIYALGRVVEGPVTRPDSIRGQEYWENEAEGLKVKPRVRVRYDKILTNRPLLKVFLEADPKLWNLAVIRAPRGTNFPVRLEEWRALQAWVNSGLESE